MDRKVYLMHQTHQVHLVHQARYHYRRQQPINQIKWIVLQSMVLRSALILLVAVSADHLLNRRKRNTSAQS